MEICGRKFVVGRFVVRERQAFPGRGISVDLSSDGTEICRQTGLELYWNW
jgi:hypothetical protein